MLFPLPELGYLVGQGHVEMSGEDGLAGGRAYQDF